MAQESCVGALQATSREPLWVDGEVSHRLAPLPLALQGASPEEIGASPAVRLFRERAGARQGEALETERASRITGELCRRVDGLPLAIELAEWSDALLGSDERRLLHRMEVFAGGFDLAAVHGICGNAGQSAAQIADLTVRRPAQFTVKATGKNLRDEQLHLWTLNDRGQVVAFRHYLDTAKHIDASTP